MNDLQLHRTGPSGLEGVTIPSPCTNEARNLLMRLEWSIQVLAIGSAVARITAAHVASANATLGALIEAVAPVGQHLEVVTARLETVDTSIILGVCRVRRGRNMH